MQRRYSQKRTQCHALIPHGNFSLPFADPILMGVEAYSKLFPVPGEANKERSATVVFDNPEGLDIQLRWVRSHENEVILSSKYATGAKYLAYCGQAFRVYSKVIKSSS